MDAPTTSDLRQKLQRLDDVELDALILEHFPSVFDRLDEGMRGDKKINLLLDHCRQYPDGAELLSGLLEKPEQGAVRSRLPLDIPACPEHFRGRQEELAQLLGDLQPGRVVALYGPDGIGKAALVWTALWGLTNQGRTPPEQFPDGVIYHTFYHQPQADLALEHIARVYGKEPRPTPKLAARQALAGRSALLVLEGAEAADNLGAVLDIRGSCAVLVTSRERDDRIAGSRDMTPLSIDEAAGLLAVWSGNLTGSESMRRICDLVGQLPLAVKLAGHYLASTRENDRTYLEWLEKSPLAALKPGERREGCVPLLLEHSLSQVSSDALEALAVAGVLAPAPFEWEAVRMGLGWDEMRAEQALRVLVGFGLLGKCGRAYQASHALVHTYARQRLAVPSGSLARLARHYGSLVRLTRHYKRLAEAAHIQTAGGWKRVDAALPHVMRLIELLQEQGEWRRVNDLAMTVDSYLNLTGRWLEQAAVGQAGVEAARALREAQTESAWLGGLGNIYSLLGQAERATEYYQQALAISREIGDQWLEGAVLGCLGSVYRDLGQVKQAIEHYEQALAIARQIGDRRRVGSQVGHLGLAHRDLGQVEQAIEHYEQALAIARGIGDHSGERKQLVNLGDTYSELGKMRRAIEYYKQALAILPKSGERSEEGSLWGKLGNAYSELKQMKRAIENYQQALAIFRESSDRRNEGIWLNSLGNAYRRLRQVERAIENYTQALAIARETGERGEEGGCLRNLGEAYIDLGQPDTARAYLQQALDIFIEIESPYADKVRRELDACV